MSIFSTSNSDLLFLRMVGFLGVAIFSLLTFLPSLGAGAWPATCWCWNWAWLSPGSWPGPALRPGPVLPYVGSCAARPCSGGVASDLTPKPISAAMQHSTHCIVGGRLT